MSTPGFGRGTPGSARGTPRFGRHLPRFNRENVAQTGLGCGARFGPSMEQRACAEAVRRVLAAHCPPKLVRAAADDPAARRGELWRHLAELGLFGILVPPEHGGLGLSEVDAVLVAEELGRAAAPGPIMETMLVAPGLVPAARLPALADGGIAVAVGLDPDPYVADADVADLVVLDTGVASVSAVHLTPQPSVDPSRPLFTPALGDMFAPIAGNMSPKALDRGALGTAALLLGLASLLLDATVAYARTRRQFGRPIGQFQAVQHRLADVLVAIEFARPLVLEAARDLGTFGASAAKLAATDAADEAARAALQVHGAIGYTAELDLHLWLRRVWSLRTAWGTPEWHRARLADAVLLPGSKRPVDQ